MVMLPNRLTVAVHYGSTDQRVIVGHALPQLLASSGTIAVQKTHATEEVLRTLVYRPAPPEPRHEALSTDTAAQSQVSWYEVARTAKSMAL